MLVQLLVEQVSNMKYYYIIGFWLSQKAVAVYELTTWWVSQLKYFFAGSCASSNKHNDVYNVVFDQKVDHILFDTKKHAKKAQRTSQTVTEANIQEHNIR